MCVHILYIALCVSVWLSVHVYVDLYVCLSVHVDTCVYVVACVCVYRCMIMHVCVWAYIHVFHGFMFVGFCVVLCIFCVGESVCACPHEYVCESARALTCLHVCLDIRPAAQLSPVLRERMVLMYSAPR